jgi:adenine-specific DNA-methyltransferase
MNNPVTIIEPATSCRQLAKPRHRENDNAFTDQEGPVPRGAWSLPEEFCFRPDLSTSEAPESIIVKSENLVALKALTTPMRKMVRCVYLDPPYNNQEVYRHYRDDHSHEEWLDATIERLRAVQPLLARNGSVWISIDDRAMHYLKVEADRVFGRDNFVSTIVWQQRTTRENRKVFSNNHEYLLVYAADAQEFKKSRNLLPGTETLLSRYKNPDNDPRGPWQSVSANVQDGHATAAQFYELIAPNGKRHRPPEGRCWVYSWSRMQAEIKAGNIWFGTTGNGVPRIKRFLKDSKVGLTPETLWRADEAGTNDEAKKHLLQMFPDRPIFDTPKPEPLLARILHIATDPGDWVLDPYLGSGTTAAVAHKMGRRYVGIEQGYHAVTYCAERLKLVIEGEPGGVSTHVAWSGGGAFGFYERKN